MTCCRYFLVVVAAVASLATSAVNAQDDCADAIPIYSIQGAGHVSSLVNQTVRTCGVVTAVAFSGYYLQDPEGDGDDATSDGIYVSQRNDKPQVGDFISLSAQVAEIIGGGAGTGNLSVTTLVDVEALDRLSDMELPNPVVIGEEGRLPPSEVVISESEITDGINLQNAFDAEENPFNPSVDGIDFYESLEGMRVTIDDPVAISGIRQFGNFSAEVFVLADGGSNATPADARTFRGGIRLQPDSDNRGDQNPERIQIQFDGTLFGSVDYPAIKVGDALESVTGVMGYSFGNFEVLAVGDVRVLDGGLEPETSRLGATANTMTLASYNVLNLSAVDADNDQRALIASQIVDNLKMPDVIALQEVQDNNGDVSDCPGDDSAACAGVLDASQTLQRLTDAIVEAGGVVYSSFTIDPLVETMDDNRDNVDTFGGASLGNIRNAFLYNPERVTLLDAQGFTRDKLQQLGVSVPTAFDTSRDPLVATFEFNGESVSIINNHFSSRFGSSPIFGGPQPFVQAGEENRAAQSLAMNELVDAALKDYPEANIVVLGDLNTFEFTDELADVLPAASGEQILFNLLETDFQDPYSFIFEGNSQALDHIFVSPSLSGSAVVDYVHVNVDFPRLFSSIVASDHEPLVAALSIGTPSEVGLGLRSEVYSETALELFWNRSGTIDRYDVYRDDTFVASSGAVSFFDDSLQPGTEYRYGVEGYSEGTLKVIESIYVTTDSPGGPGVFPVQQLTGSVYSASALEIFWTVSDFSQPPAGFDILRNGEYIGTTDGRSFFEEGLQSETTYEYSVIAFGVGSDVSSPQTIQLTTRSFSDMSGVNAGPPAVVSLSGLVYSSSAVEIFWSEPESGSPAIEYQVVRNGELVETNDGRSYFDSDLQQGTTYVYSVKPLDALGNAGPATEVQLTTNSL